MANYSINLQGNVKTGAIPVTSSDKTTCPDTCPLKGGNGCYAENHWANIQWDKLTSGESIGALSFTQLLAEIKKLAKFQLWRMNEKGDLNHNNGVIDTDSLNAIVKANKGKSGFTYTHHNPMIESNLNAIKSAVSNGFTINLSANNAAQADEYITLGLPVVTLLDSNAPMVSETAKGVKIVVCPEETKGIKCAACGLCQKADRSFIIGFRAHGTRKKKVELIASSH